MVHSLIIQLCHGEWGEHNVEGPHEVMDNLKALVVCIESVCDIAFIGQSTGEDAPFGEEDVLVYISVLSCL